MAELSVVNVENYSNGLLSASDPRTQYFLDAALAAARQETRWHVSPVITGDVFTLNGYGSNRIKLPTQMVVAVDSVTNDGVTLDLSTDVTLDIGSQYHNNLYINNGLWSNSINGIVVTVDHGWTEQQAADWRNAILALTVNMAEVPTIGRSEQDMISKSVDDIVYRWSETPGLASIESTLSKYRLLFEWV
jgi:hypothetical protein